MNAQQARIWALIEELYDAGARSEHDVDMADQTALAEEGYDLSALDDDLFTLDFNKGN